MSGSPESGETSATGSHIIVERTFPNVAVSLNELVLSIDSLTSARLREILRAGPTALDKIAACGCDGKDCGCFGSACPCNKLHSGQDDAIRPPDSIEQFLRFREAQITRLRQELEALQATEQQLDRLRK